jgi:hypothetical protein
MFNWLKRRSAAPSRPAKKQAGSPRPPARKAAEPAPLPPFALSAPLPEVVAEGNTQADWSQWEDSMTALDSQMQSLEPSARVHVRDTRPSQLDDLDAFSSVRGKRR